MEFLPFFFELRNIFFKNVLLFFSFHEMHQTMRFNLKFHWFDHWIYSTLGSSWRGLDLSIRKTAKIYWLKWVWFLVTYCSLHRDSVSFPSAFCLYWSPFLNDPALFRISARDLPFPVSRNLEPQSRPLSFHPFSRLRGRVILFFSSYLFL